MIQLEVDKAFKISNIDYKHYGLKILFPATEVRVRFPPRAPITCFNSVVCWLVLRILDFLCQATDLTAGEATPMDDERIETRWFTRREVAEMIASGKIEDAKTMVGFFRMKS